jgi:hypothetical protein
VTRSTPATSATGSDRIASLAKNQEARRALGILAATPVGFVAFGGFSAFGRFAKQQRQRDARQQRAAHGRYPDQRGMAPMRQRVDQRRRSDFAERGRRQGQPFVADAKHHVRLSGQRSADEVGSALPLAGWTIGSMASVSSNTKAAWA